MLAMHHAGDTALIIDPSLLINLVTELLTRSTSCMVNGDNFPDFFLAALNINILSCEGMYSFVNASLEIKPLSAHFISIPFCLLFIGFSPSSVLLF